MPLIFWIFWHRGNQYAATLMIVFLSQGCNEPLIFRHQSQWSSENWNRSRTSRLYDRMRTSHLARFLIDIFQRNEHYEASFGTDEDREGRSLCSRIPPPHFTQCCQLLEKNSLSTTTKQYSYFMDMPRNSR